MGNWENQEAVIFTKDGGDTYGERPYRHVDIDKEHLQPPVSMMISMIMRTIWRKSKVFLKNKKNQTTYYAKNPTQLITMANAMFMASLIISLSLLPTCMGEERFVKNFIYELENDNIQMNSGNIWVARRWLPCDLYLTKQILDELVEANEELCKTDFRMKGLEENDIIKDMDKDFILLKGKHNVITAEKLCSSIGTSLVEIRDRGTTAAALQSFMGLHRIKTIFAGIEWNELTQEVLFKSDGVVGTYAFEDHVHYYYKGYESTMNRHEAIKHEQDETYIKHGGTYLYKNNGNAIDIWLNFEKSTYKKPDNSFEAWKTGQVTKHHVICKRRKNTINPMETNYKKWQSTCRQNMKSMKEKVDNAKFKLEQILPENLPATFQNLSPFINMHKMQQEYPDHKENTTSEPNLMEDANTKWASLIEQDKTTTVMQCLEAQDDREKRFPSIMAIGSIISTVFTATDFFIKMYPLIEQKLTIMKNERQDEETSSGVLESLKDISAMTTGLMKTHQLTETHFNMTYTMTTQNTIQESIATLLDYVDHVYERITTLVYREDYKPANPMEFMSTKRLEEITRHVSKKFNVKLLNDIRKTSTYVANSGNSFLIASSIAYDNLENQHELYKIHKVPTIINNYQHFPLTEAKYVAIAKHEDKWTPLTTEEGKICSKKGICSSNSPTFERTETRCGYTNFWEDPKTCKFKPTKIKGPHFTIIGNRTFFQAGPKPIKVRIDCTAQHMNKPGDDKFEILTKRGYLDIPFSCKISYGKMTMRPAIRELTAPRIKYNPIATVLEDEAIKKNKPKPKLGNTNNNKSIFKNPIEQYLETFIIICGKVFGICLALGILMVIGMAITEWYIQKKIRKKKKRVREVAEQIKKSLKQQQENNIKFEGPRAIVHATNNEEDKGAVHQIVSQKIDKANRKTQNSNQIPPDTKQ